jgi:hypothetical protein
MYNHNLCIMSDDVAPLIFQTLKGAMRIRNSEESPFTIGLRLRVSAKLQKL